jgi:hypothetical protein
MREKGEHTPGQNCSRTALLSRRLCHCSHACPLPSALTQLPPLLVDQEGRRPPLPALLGSRLPLYAPFPLLLYLLISAFFHLN